jgi:hypothetical protein
MRAPFEDHVIAFASIALLASIAVLFKRRSAYRLFPWFFAYVIYHILQTITTEAVDITQGLGWTYIWTYYSTQVISLTLSFAVIHELFSSVVRPYRAFNYVGTMLFILAAICLAIVALLMVVFGSGPGINRLAYAVFVTLRSLRIVQLGLLLLLFLLARSLGLSWRSYSFGIALGYGLYAAVDLVLVAVRAEFGEGIWHLHSLLTTTAFTGMLLVWLVYILQRQAVAQPVRVIPYNDIAKWNEKLQELLKPKTATKTDIEEEENDDQPVSR